MFMCVQVKGKKDYAKLNMFSVNASFCMKLSALLIVHFCTSQTRLGGILGEENFSRESFPKTLQNKIVIKSLIESVVTIK